MKKIVSCLMLFALGCIGFVSCKDDKNDPDQQEEKKVQVKFIAVPAIEGTVDAQMMEKLVAVFTEIRNQDTTHCVINSAGIGTVSLNKGTYNIAIEEKIKNAAGADSIVISSRMENVSVNATDQEIKGKLSVAAADALGKNFIFSEIFFNGETNSGRMMHPDQYFVVFNATEDTLYADGLSVAVTQQICFQNKQMWYDSYYPDRVPIGGFVTVPGNGKDHPVAPGDKFVVAFTAIDHSSVTGYDHAVDLTGADFEIYYGPEEKDVDNPEVPNMLLVDFMTKASYGFFMHPRGYISPLMFKLENGKQEAVNKFLKENTSESKTLIPKTATTPEEIVEVQILSVATDRIIDGVQTSDVPQDVKTRVIPESVDRGKFLVNGCHRQELAIRRQVKVGNRIFYKDTNNSSEDMVMQKGQHAWPKGWRNK